VRKWRAILWLLTHRGDDAPTAHVVAFDQPHVHAELVVSGHPAHVFWAVGDDEEAD
jgi:hypothetical protein